MAEGSPRPLWAIIPVKPFAEAKTRLGPVLTPTQRYALVRAGLARTLGLLAGVEAIELRLVVSRDPTALALATDLDCDVFAEDPPGGLNEALTAATSHAQAAGASGVLVIATDLPLLTATEVTEMIAQSTGESVVIAPDRRNEGTNALLVRPPGLIEFAFGVGSFAEHSARAKAAGAVASLRAQGFAHDLDLPDDLIELQRLGWTLPELVPSG